jgi:histidine ammonia-lyase
MGSISGRKLNRVLDNLEFILAIELLSACQAIEFRRPLESSELLEFAHHYVREFVSFAAEDRILLMISTRSPALSKIFLLWRE